VRLSARSSASRAERSGSETRVATPTVRKTKEIETLMSNSTTLAGNLTRDPEVQYTKEGQTKATFGLAVNRRWQNKNSDTWEEATSFFDVVCWRELAENVALSLVKGTRVIVSGHLEQHSWQLETGDRRSRVELTADEVGPSLRFATAEVTKSERRYPGQGDPTGGSELSMDEEVARANA
jgi:single-strand DNA-binding protein